jgi:hypothetical protein
MLEDEEPFFVRLETGLQPWRLYETRLPPFAVRLLSALLVDLSTYCPLDTIFGSTLKKLLTKMINDLITFGVSHLWRIRHLTFPHHPILLIQRKSILLIVMVVHFPFWISALTEICWIVVGWHATKLVWLYNQDWFVSHLLLWDDHWRVWDWVLLGIGFVCLATVIYVKAWFGLIAGCVRFKEFSGLLLFIAAKIMVDILLWCWVSVKLIILRSFILFVALTMTNRVIIWWNMAFFIK